MSLQAGTDWSYQDLHFYGLSLSGIRTSLTFPTFHLCFDVAQGLPFALQMKKFFLTHGHLDHAAGVPYIISQKAMHSEKTPDFYMPASLVEPLTQIMRIWEKVEKHEYRFNFHAVDESSVIEINNQLEVRPFKTLHRVDSFGYSLIQKNRKLKAEYQNLRGDEIRDLKSSGVEVAVPTEEILFSFTGDTQIEFLDMSPQVKKSKVLFLEATYIDDSKSIAKAKEWGHTHLDEIIPRLDEIESEKIVLIHISSRYSTRYAIDVAKKRIPAKHQDRIVIFPGR
jgi:ribonuclease Z